MYIEFEVMDTSTTQESQIFPDPFAATVRPEEVKTGKQVAAARMSIKKQKVRNTIYGLLGHGCIERTVLKINLTTTASRNDFHLTLVKISSWG